MDAIETRFIPATNTRGSRVKATRLAPGGESSTIGYDHALNSWDNHRAAAECLITKLGTTGVTFVGGDTATGTVWVADIGAPHSIIRVVEGVES